MAADRLNGDRVRGYVLGGVVALMLCAWPTVATAQSENATHAAIGAFLVGQMSDGMVSAYGFGAGTLREVNPILTWTQDRPVSMAIVKGSLAASVSTILMRTHKRNPKATFWTAIALAGVQAAVTYHNARLIRRGRS